MRKPVAGTTIAAIVLTFVQLFGTVNAAAATIQDIHLGFSGSAPAQSMLHIGGGQAGVFSAGAALDAGLDWQAADQVGVSYTADNLRQGSLLDLTDTTTPGAGTVSVHYRATGNLSADSFDKSVTDSIPCAMPLAGDPANTCTGNTLIALDSITLASAVVASLKVVLSLRVATTITATGSPLETTRTASVAGGLAIPAAPLSLIGPTPGQLTDPMSLTSLACTQPAGSRLVYSLTANHTTGTLVMVTTVDLVASIVASSLLGDVIGPTVTISPSSVSSPSVPFSLAMNAPDAGVDLGAILPNVTPPTVNAGGPYSGVEGAPVLFDGSASSDKCGPPALAWTFGDGTSATGPRPTHTYAEEGVYGATLTATNVTGLSSTSSFDVVVSDAALSALGRTIITAQAFSGTVASFTDADPAGAVADYTATINWGDGTTTTVGTVSAVAGGFTVSSAHTFAAAALGPQTFSTTICDAGGSCVTTTSQALVFSYTVGGSFAVGDSAAGVLTPGAIGTGSPVTFWGAQWARANGLSGGSAPSSFKGFSNDPSTPVCGMTWSTNPGNSAPPAADVPAYTAMLVADSISKSGAHLTGDAPHIVIVKTSPGYAPDPGHSGLGVVVGVLC